MKIPRGDGGKPISYGDPSYIYHGIYNPIVWVGEEAYRPRVETLVVRNRFEVFLRLYDKVKNGSRYTIPGGSVDADSTKIEQAENETNEEALFEIKNIYYTGIQYYDRYTPGFNRSGGDSPIEYAGTINDVFVAEYSGPFDKSKVEPKDLDPDIADNGKFYPIGDVLNYLRPEHLRALSDSKLVDNVVRTNILIAMSNGDVKRAVSESLTPDFDVVPPPGEFIYHGSRFEIDVFHPMSIDFGNAKQKPGWSTFCFADPTLALRFGLMRTIQNALGDGCDSDDVKFCCEWNFETNRPYIAKHQTKEIFNKVIGLKFYVYHIQTEGLDIGIGNDIRFPEYTFREDNIRPRFVSTYTIDRALMDANMDYLDLISITGCEEYLYGSEDIKKRHYAAFINRDYARDPAIKKVIKAIDTGELRPGDDVEEYMRTNGFIPEEVSWEELTELSGINTKLVAMTAENLRYHKSKNQTSMLRHVSPPSPTSSGYFLEDSQGNMVGFVVVDTHTSTITALEVVKRYRRLGIGKELLDVAQNRLRAKFVGINKRNTAAIDMYKKWNWEVYREDDNSFYLKAPGVTYTMEGYGFLPSTFAAMVPVTEQRLTAADRKQLSDKDYGIPSLRKYPMSDKKHVISAIQYFNKVEPKYETELARNILKKIKEFDMEEVVSVSQDNRFAKYAPKTMLENEDVTMESSYREDDVIYQNFERFTSNECNYCLVTGLSGSGKSTLTQKMSEQYDAKWIELDLFTYGVKKWSKEGSVMWSKDYPFLYYMKTRPDLCKLAEKQSKSEWLKVVDNEKENVAFIKFAIEWAKERPDKRYIIEGVQILVFCKAEMLAGEPLILIDRSVARSYRQRLKREIHDWETFIRELKFTPNVMKYYYEDAKSKARFKDEVIESTHDLDSTETLQESVSKHGNIIEYNVEDFTSGKSNVLIITGLSASGKSTMADKYADKYGAIHIELDQFSGVWKQKYTNRMHEVYAGYFRKHPDIESILRSRNYSNDEFRQMMLDFFVYLFDYCDRHRNQKFVVEGVQIFYLYRYIKDRIHQYSMIINDIPIPIVMLRRWKREIPYGPTDFINDMRNVSNVVKMYKEDRDFLNDMISDLSVRESAYNETMEVMINEPLNQFNNFKKEILESTFIDIDELKPGYGEKSYGTPIDRTIDNVSSRELESRYEKFVVAKYLHHGEYFGYTDWEKSIGEYITKKEYDMGLYYVYGNNNGYPEYIGQILVDSDKNWHWYEAASPMAVTESWNTHDDEKEILIKLVNDLRLWQYGYVYHEHCYTNCDHNTSFTHRYRTLSTPDFEKYKCGTCFDYTVYIYQKMFSLCTEDEEQFMTQCYYIEAVDADGDRPCHTFPIVRLRNGKYYWLEAAWKQIAGTREYNSLQEALDDVVDNFLQSYNLVDYKILCEFVPDNRFVGVDCYTFMRLAGSNTNIRR